MKQGWEIKRLDDVCEVEYGTRVVNRRDGGTIYPVYGGGGATFFMDTFNRENCFIVARFAMSQQCTRFVEGKFFLNDSGLSVKPRNQKEILQDFLNLQMLFLNDYIYSLARGTAQKNLDVPAFRNIEISFPKSLPEQKRIVAILDEAFSAISKAKDNAEQNLKNAKELFESYLQEVLENGDWEEKTLGQLSKNKDAVVSGPFGSNLKVSDYKTEGIPILRLQNIGKGYFINKSIKYITKQKAEELKYHSFVAGDIALAKLGIPIGKTCIIPENFKSGIITADIVRIRPDLNVVNYKFLENFLNTSLSVSQLTGNISGATRPRVNLSDVRNIVIKLPSLKEQETIVKKLDSLSLETKRLEAIYQTKINDLEELKKSLLQKAFSGELKTAKALV